MIHGFIKTIDNIDFLYGFICECANLINNLDDYDNYNYENLAIKLCSEFIKEYNEHIKEFNVHIKDIIGNLESIKDIYSICSYLMNICCERYFKLSQDQYLEIKQFIDNNIDIIESALAPMSDYFDSCKKYYSHYYCSCYYYPKKKLYVFFLRIDIKNFMKKIIKSYFNIWYIKFFYLLQKNIKLNKNIYNIGILMNIFMNLYDNSGIDCNKKNKNKIYDLYNNIVLNKFVHSNKYKNTTIFTIYK